MPGQGAFNPHASSDHHSLPFNISIVYYFLIHTYITLLLIYYYISHSMDLFCLFYLSFFLCLNKLVINLPSPRVLSFCHGVWARLRDSWHQVIGTFCLHDFSHFSQRQVLLKHWYREFEIKKRLHHECFSCSFFWCVPVILLMFFPAVLQKPQT